MEMYFLKSAACLAILMVFYKFLLEKENMHVFKRWYLLATVFISFIIPWITFTSYIEPVPGESALIFQPEIASDTSSVEETSTLSYLLWSLYVIGLMFFGIKFILNLKIILLRIKRNPKIRSGQTTNVLLQEKLAPHTFWSYIFLNKRKYEENEIPQEVFQHEQAHADQRHSADILIMELLQIIFWFNPVLYMVKKAIRLNHEFLADRAVLKNGIQTSTYQKTLLAFSSNAFDSNLVNPINYQSIKKRFTVMKTNTSRKMIWTKSLVLLPLLAVLTYSFSTQETRFKPGSVDFEQKENYTVLPSGDTIVITEDINIRMISTEHLLLNGNSISYDELPGMLEQLNSHIPPEDRNEMISAEISTTKEFPVGWLNDVKRALYYYGITRPRVTLTGTSEEKKWQDLDKATPEHEKAIKKELEKVSHLKIQYNQPQQDQEEATPAMIDYYNGIAKKYSSKWEKEKVSFIPNEFIKMQNIYKVMTAEQKRNAEPYPKIPNKYRFQEVATPEMVKEYNNLAKKLKKYNEKSDYGKSHPKDASPIPMKDIQRMKYIYSIMSENQKKKAEPLPGFYPPPPPPPPTPTVKKDGDVPPPPPPPPAPTVEKTGDMPAPPPPPPSPIEAVEGWIEEGVTFFLNGEEISGKEALEVVQENNGKNLSVQVEENASGKTVRLSDNKK